MCKKLIVLALSLCMVSSAFAKTISFDFENVDDHSFDFWSVSAAWPALDDPTIAGDEALTGAGGAVSLPDNGVAWTVGPPNQYDGQTPVVEEGCHVVNGVLEYGPCNDPFGVFDTDPPSYVNSRGQSGYLNTYNLNQWGDNLHVASNDQIATSPVVILGEGSVLTVWSLGGGSGTHAPEYDAVEVQMYTDGSSGIAVLSAEEDDMYAMLATVHTQGQGTLTEDILDLSAFAGKKVFIEVVDAFQGSWGFLAIDEIQITNAISKSAGFMRDVEDGNIGFDDIQIARLESMGYVVTEILQSDVEDGLFTIDDADALDLLIISESIGSASADPLIGTTTPVMMQEGHALDNWGFNSSPSVAAGWQNGAEMEVVNDTHPIAVAAGLSVGPMTFYSQPTDFTTDSASSIAPGAVSIVTTIPDAAGDAYAKVYAIDEGAALADGNDCPNRAVVFLLTGWHLVTEDQMTDEAWALYDAAIVWLDPPAAVVPPMVAHWPLDDGAGTVATDVVGGHDGELVGSVSWIDGALDGAVTFDTTDPNSSIYVPDDAELDFGDVDFSISMMVRYPVAPPSAEHEWITKGSYGGDTEIGSRYAFYHKNTEMRFDIDNGPANIKSSLSVSDAPVVTGEWVHMVAVRDAVNDMMYIYADGVLQGELVETSGDISSPGEHMYIGNSLRNNAPCEADIDDVRIYDAALTEDVIAAIY